MKSSLFGSSLIPILLVSQFALAQPDQDDAHTHHHGHDHQSAHDHSEMTAASEAESNDGSAVMMSKTPELEAALAAGGTPIVAEVLGVVCDFCATAMNKVFGAREEVAAVYVDLDTKALNLVLKAGSDLDNATIESLAVQAGYRIAAVHRDPKMQGS